jgi:hypothetical protein
MYGICTKLVCLSKPVKVTDINENIHAHRVMSIFCTLRIRNVLLYRPLELYNMVLIPEPDVIKLLVS